MNNKTAPAVSPSTLTKIDAWLQRRHQFWLWLIVIAGATADLAINSVLGLVAVLSAIPVIGPVISAIAVFIAGLDSAMLFVDEAAISVFPTLCVVELLRRFKVWLSNF